MDVERLMQDLTVEQLDNIHGSLLKEMEQKKEELREMVGRRYRDVLEASTQLRETHAQAAKLADLVAKARTLAPPDPPKHHRDEVRSLLSFIAINRLFPVIGSEAENADGLSDAFGLLLVEQIHKQLLSDSHPPAITAVLPTYAPRISRLRRWLCGQMTEELAGLSRPDWAAVQLASMALVQNLGIEQLMDAYLEARKKKLQSFLKEEDSTLLSVFEEIKFTLQVVERLFVRGDLSSLLQAVTSHEYCPALLAELLSDQTLAVEGYMRDELSKILRTQIDRRTAHLTTQRISEKCLAWIDGICEIVHPSVDTICKYHEKPTSILEFLKALAVVMNEDWPHVISGSSLYQKMFGVAVLNKFKELLTDEVEAQFSKVLASLETTQLTPPPLFEKRAANHYDTILATGLSKQLQKSVLTFLHSVHALRDLCLQYEKYGLEGEASSSKVALANCLASRLMSLPNHADIRGLTLARIALAFLQVDPTSICGSLNRDPALIQKCSKALNSAAEQGLTAHVEKMAQDLLTDEAFRAYLATLSDPLASLEICSEWEQMEVPEIGTLGVPIAPSSVLMALLCSLNQHLGSTSLLHLLSRSVRISLADTVTNRLADLFSSIVESNVTLPQRVWIQVLFDARLAFSIMPNDRLRTIPAAFESRIDPFELAVLAQPLANNVRQATLRAQLLWSGLAADIMPIKESTVSSSFMAVTDLLPRPSEHPQRIPAIPRLDRSIGENGLKKMRSRDVRTNKLLAGTDGRGKGSAPSLTSMYEKVTGFTGGWFGN